MARRKPITQRFKGSWILRARVWEPVEYRGRQEHSSIQVEYRLLPGVGKFLQQLFLYWDQVDDGIVHRLGKIGEELSKRNRDARKVRDVMES